MMDELKEMYGIDMSLGDKKMVAIDILTNEWERTAHVLEIASNAEQRIYALKKQKAIRYVLLLMEKENDSKN